MGLERLEKQKFSSLRKLESDLQTPQQYFKNDIFILWVQFRLNVLYMVNNVKEI